MKKCLTNMSTGLDKNSGIRGGEDRCLNRAEVNILVGCWYTTFRLWVAEQGYVQGSEQVIVPHGTV